MISLAKQFERVRVVAKAKTLSKLWGIQRHGAERVVRTAVRLNKGICFEHRPETEGLAALYNYCLAMLSITREAGIGAHLRVCGSVYSDSPDDNLLSRFWEQEELDSGFLKISTRRYEQLPRSLPPPDFETANALWRSQFQLNAHSRRLLEAHLAALNLKPGHFSSVHFRSSDKVIEAIPPGHDEVIDRVRATLLPDEPVFVATDDPTFALLMRKEFGDLARVPDHLRASGTTVAHHAHEGQRARVADEAQTTLLVLAASRAVVKSPSMLLGFACVLNSFLEVHPVGRQLPHTTDWFPDSLIFGGGLK